MLKYIRDNGLYFDILDTDDNSVEKVLPCVIYKALDSGIEIEDLPDLSYLSKSYIGSTRKMRNGYYVTCVGFRDEDDCDFEFEIGVVRSHVKWRNYSRGRLGFKINDYKIGRIVYQFRVGLNAKCISYNSDTDLCEIEFEDGTKRNDVKWHYFVKGSVGLNSRKVLKQNASLVGVKVLMNCGLYAVCIKYEGYRHLTIRFEDGFIKSDVEKRAFLNGSVKNDNLNPYSIVGYENIMSCGFKAKCIADRGCHDIDIEFEDGTIVKNCERAFFRYGVISHPDIIHTFRDSLSQRLVYHYIKIHFDDALYCYRPDWLTNYYTGRNLELDIFIPSLKVGIEYDGSWSSHTELTVNNIVKAELIDNSDKIDKLFTICNEDCIYYESDKRINFIMENYSNYNIYYKNLYSIINKILNSLGVSIHYEPDFYLIKSLQLLRR